MIGVILAAGESKRFGSCKQVHLIDDKPMILHTFEALNSLIPTYVILGAYTSQIKEVLPHQAQTILNENYKKGQWTSVQMALDKAVDLQTDLLLTLADLPYITVGDYQELIDRYRNRPLFSRFNQAYGPPCLLPYQSIKKVRLTEGEKLKSIFDEKDFIQLDNAARDIDLNE
jgi:molybdenum cofactor cytidylyltransferase